MTTLQKQKLLDRMVTRLVEDKGVTETTRELTVRTTRLLREVRDFNKAMSNTASTNSQSIKKR